MANQAVQRWLESSPGRHEAGLACLTLGRGSRLFWSIAQRWVAPGDRLLDLDCATGVLGVECALRGAVVTALSPSPAMLARARLYEKTCGMERAIRFVAGEVLEADRIFAGEQFDVITSSFLLSEMSKDERQALLTLVESLLSPDGRFIVADEIVPSRCARRALTAGLRWPLVTVAGLISGHVNRPLKGFELTLRKAGWRLRSRTTLLGGTIGVLVAERVSRPVHL